MYKPVVSSIRKPYDGEIMMLCVAFKETALDKEDRIPIDAPQRLVQYLNLLAEKIKSDNVRMVLVFYTKEAYKPLPPENFQTVVQSVFQGEKLNYRILRVLSELSDLANRNAI
jgi:hypothetical protein